MQLIPMIAALAVVAGIREETGVDSWIRWPNDIVIDRKKVAGTIAEVDYRGARFSHIVLGVGVNCNFLPEKLESFSPDSTTLLAVLGKRVRIGQLRKRILDSLGPLYYAWDAEDDDTLLANRLAERLGTLGKRVTFETIEGKTMSGRAERLRSDGSLIVKGASGGFTLRGEQVARLREL
jgi:BirA family transcriptional regulator, biotin operon repressor / biotin---[acetyl-CoA-carboxylase] ligase